MRTIASLVLLCAAAAQAASAGDWWEDWTHENEFRDHHNWWGVRNGGPSHRKSFATGPKGMNQPFKWKRTMVIQPHLGNLHLEVATCDYDGRSANWRLVVKVNGGEALGEVIECPQGWRKFDLDLSSYAGKQVNLELWNAMFDTDWWDWALWDNVKFTSPVRGARKPGEAGHEVLTYHDWKLDWTHEGGQASPERVAKYRRHEGVWRTHPKSEGVPFKWKRSVSLPEKYQSHLEVEVSTHPSPPGDHKATSDWELVVMANGKEMHREVIGGVGWRTARVDLTEFRGQPVDLEIWNKAGGRYPWRNEYAYWGKVEIFPPAHLVRAAAEKEVRRRWRVDAGRRTPRNSGREESSRTGQEHKDKQPPRAARPSASPDAAAVWDARLQTRVIEAVRAGQTASFSVESLRQRAEIVAADNEVISFTAGPARVSLSWTRLSMDERKSLALAILRDEVKADRALAAFYLIATGDELAADDHLRRAGDLAQKVKASFR
jgi:hypothetical protein